MRRFSVTPEPLGLLMRSVLFAALMIAALVSRGDAQPVYPGMAPPERVPAVMVGDRVVNVAWHLGVVPEAMSVRGDLWAFGRTLANTSSMILGCPGYIVMKDPDIVPRILREKGLEQVLVERSDPFDRTRPHRDPMNLLPILEEAGIAADPGGKITVIDFTAGLEAAIRQIGAVLGREAQAEDLIAARRAQLDAVMAGLPLDRPGLNVLILDGRVGDETAQTFVRAHLPGGYVDDFLLTPLGVQNAAGPLADQGLDGFAALAGLDGLEALRPDVIVMTGESDAVQRQLAEALARHPDLASSVPALANHALISLPAYYDSAVVDYPRILGRWAAAFTSLIEG
ncbi:ABC transporter substrate-binding protein [Rhodovulum sulfidophilum]|uniref:ABC transporter substrate-binding protein n=1 Tax=Rhodovulum sulfidophilum TaxID=35806 RepID=UPI0009531FFE|nr:ABC transporter substrate-binding protein [Rhodovulum sulfidophilum]OLS42875.1 hypothetical protein BV392_19720 [Rhodovulum sulfidophilum]